MAGDASSLLDAARWYRARGYAPIPLPAGEKKPVIRGWNALRLSEDDLPLHFNGTGNIGLLLGEPSGWLVDVDLDCDEAVELAEQYLPPTGAVTGRPSRPGSHRWYIAVGAATVQHKDPATGAMVVELRSTGAQTVVGPSLHPDGEPYDPLDGEPAVVSAAMLAACVKALADAVIDRRRGRAKAAPTKCPQPLPDQDAERRAAAYLDAMPSAVSGQGGHGRTYAAATALVHGFELDPEAALRMLLERYNPRCVPPWSEKELRHKVEDAASKPHDRPRGWLLRTDSHHETDFDLSGIRSTHVPSPMRDDRPPDPGLLPDHLLDVPGFIGDVIRYNLDTAIRPQPVLALAGAIALQAVLAGRKVRDELGNRTNIYTIGVADSGTGKDHARKVNKKVLFQSGAIELEGNEDLASDAGLITAVETQPAVLFQMDEFGRFLRTIGDPKRAPYLYNVLTTLMKLYSSADTVFRGKAYADAKRNKVIDQPCVSVYGTTVYEHFYQSLTPDSLADGFVARLLILETTSKPSRRWKPERDVPAHITEAARWWYEYVPGGNLAAEHRQPRLVETTAEAREVFDALAATVDAQMASSQGGESAVWARAEEKACRLALVYACSANRESPVVDTPAARWACEMSEHLTRRLLHVACDWVAEGLFDARQKRVLRILRKAGGELGRSDLCRRTQALTQRERQEVIENLIETGQLIEREESTRGRKRVIYALP